MRQWFARCETSRLDPLVGIQRAHVELYDRGLGHRGLTDSAVYARPPKVHPDESRTQGLERLELIQFLQVAQTITTHHGALTYLLGFSAQRPSEAAAVEIEDYAATLRGYRCCTCRQGEQTGHHAVDRPGPASWRLAGVSAPEERWCCDRSPAIRSTGAMPSAWSPGSRKPQLSHGTSARTP